MSQELNTFSYEQLNTLSRNAEGQAIINPEIFKAQIEAGWKKKTLAAHYEIPEAQVSEICKALNVEIRKFKQKGYVIEGFSPLVELNTAKTVVKSETSTLVEEDAEPVAVDANYQEVENTDAFGNAQEEVAEVNVFTAEVDESGVDVDQEEVVENIPAKPTWNNI